MTISTDSTATSPATTSPATTGPMPDPVDLERRVRRAIDRRSFAVVSTVSAAGHPHAAGVLYANDGLALYVSTHRSSRKARNVAATGRAAIVVPVRKLPVGPAFEIQFQASAQVLDNDDPRIRDLVDRGVLKPITRHGELDEPDGCFLAITPTGRVHTYGIGVSTLAVARDPLHVGAGMIDLDGRELTEARVDRSR